MTIKVFQFEESFSVSILEKFPENIIVTGDKDSSLLLLLRSLSGAIDVSPLLYDKKIKQRRNYFAQNFVGYGSQWRTKFPKLFGEHINIKDLSDFLYFERQNNSFYQSILSELSNFILYEHKASHTTAFVYLYRIVEKISYAFPSIYFSSTDDFLNSFTSLKKLMNDTGGKGELGFFGKFINHLEKSADLSEYSIDIPIQPELNNPDLDLEKVQKSIYKEIKKILDNENIKLTEASNEPRLISIKFCDFGSVIITIRNRFFHNLNDGHDNLQSDKLIDSDIFFAQFNKNAMHWIALVFLQIITSNLEANLRLKSLVNRE